MADMRAKGRDNRTDRLRGEAHGSAKLTDQMVRDIKSRPDEKSKRLAAEFGVRPSAIQRIRNGQTWKHIS